MKALNSDISSYFGLGRTQPDGTVGIEIETEGRKLPRLMDQAGRPTSNLWTLHNEGSLRLGGFEYVSLPIKGKAIEKAAEELDKAFEESGAEIFDSIRTSTHIHVNCTQYNVRQIYSIIAAFWMVSSVLINLQGRDRKGNLFCLEVSDAEGIQDTIIHELMNGTYLHAVTRENLRYGALNLSSLAKFGTVEFRFMKGMYDAPSITKYATMLRDFVAKAVRFSVRDILNFAQNDTREKFLSRFFSPAFTQEILAHPDNQYDFLKNNISFVEMIAILLDRVREAPVLDPEDEYIPPDQRKKRPVEKPRAPPFRGERRVLRDMFVPPPDPIPEIRDDNFDDHDFFAAPEPALAQPAPQPEHAAEPQQAGAGQPVNPANVWANLNFDDDIWIGWREAGRRARAAVAENIVNPPVVNEGNNEDA